MDKETLWRKLAQNQGDYYELMAAARGVIPEDVLKGYERGVGHTGVSDGMVKLALEEFKDRRHDYDDVAMRSALIAALTSR